MLVYVAIYCGLLGTNMLGKTNPGRLVFLGWWLFLLLFVGTRVNTGNDWRGYSLRYKFADPDYPLTDLLTDSERGFSALEITLKGQDLSFQWFILCCAAIFFACLLRFCWGYRERLLILALFVPVVITQLVMSGLRQATALAFVLLALHAFSQKQRAGVIGWTIVATQFHASACAFLPLAFMVGKREIRLRNLILSLLVALPLALFLIGDRAETYHYRYVTQGAEMTSSGAALRLALLFFSSGVFWRYRVRYKAFFPDTFPLLQVFALVPVLLLPMFLINSVAVHRLIYYAMPVHLLILGLLPQLSRNPAAVRKSRFLPLAVYGVYQVAWFMFSRHAALGYIPYRSVLL